MSLHKLPLINVLYNMIINRQLTYFSNQYKKKIIKCMSKIQFNVIKYYIKKNQK